MVEWYKVEGALLKYKKPKQKQKTKQQNIENKKKNFDQWMGMSQKNH